ncbi:MAG: uracil-DNA glycosylase, partial [Pseudomonadota bacterium]
MDARLMGYLEAMGITVFVRRDLASAEPAGSVPRSPDTDAADPGDALVDDVRDAPPPRGSPAPETGPVVSTAAGPDACDVPRDLSGMDWEALRTRVTHCQACALHQGRTHTVFGVGSPQADLMVIGEAPGAEEDRRGEPFVGRAGQLLTAMLAAIGLAREQVYIANILKCRPPGNRNPAPAEAACCRPFLDRQIALVQPRVILSVGGVSAHNLLGTEEAVGRLRGTVHHYHDVAGTGDSVPVVVSYHPAYLLRKPREKAKAWQDLLRVRGMLD